MAPAHRDLGDNDTVSAFVWCRHECVHTAIRLTINEIVEIAALALLPPLVEDSAPPEWFRKQVPELALGGLAKFSFLNIDTDDDVGFQSQLVMLLHVRHEAIGGFQGRAIDIKVVVPKCRGSGQKQADEE